MSQLICPLCGRFVSLKIFNPSGFELDIFTVNVRGLGRGRGVKVSEIFSALDEPEITGPIADRCRVLLRLIEGSSVPKYDDLLDLQREIKKWKREALESRTNLDVLHAKITKIEERVNYWKREAQSLQRLLNEQEAQLAISEEASRRWINQKTDMENEAKRLRSQVQELENQLHTIDEEETLAMDEMGDLLDMINTSANTDFDYLIDAVEFLLEGG